MKAAFPQPAYRLQCLKSVLFCSLLLRSLRAGCYFSPIAQLGQGKLLLFSDFALSFEHVTVSTIVQQDLPEDNSQDFLGTKPPQPPFSGQHAPRFPHLPWKI